MQTNLAGTSKKDTHLSVCVFFCYVKVRFEPLNAIVRWTIARIRLDGFDTLCSAKGRTAPNLAGTFLRNVNFILFHNIDEITDIILHNSIHTVCYCVGKEANCRKYDIIEEV